MPFATSMLLAFLAAPVSAVEPAAVPSLAEAQPVTEAQAWIPTVEDLRVRPQPAACEGAPCTWAQRDDIWIRTEAGERRLTQGEDRFYDPVLSPDGRRVVFSGLITGLHVMDLHSGELVHLGPGRWPSWHPSQGWLVFERNHDDGHQLVSADLRLWHSRLDDSLPLTDSPDTLDRAPLFSPDGSQLVWLRDDAVWIARLQEVTP